MTAEPFVMLRTRQAMKAAFKPGITHYELLGVSPGACDEVSLKAARNAVAREFHPDRTDYAEAPAIMARANDAYAALSTPSERKHYDAKLRSTHTPCISCTGEGFKLKSVGFTKQTRLRCLGCAGYGWVPKATKLKGA